MSELEQSAPDVNSGESSPSPESTGSESGQNVDQQSTSESQSKQEQYVPYDRFKEMVEAKNQFSKQFEETQKQLQELKNQFEKQSRPQEASKPSIDPKKVLERLKGIDPEFAQYNEYLMGELQKAQDFQTNMHRQNYLTSATSTVERLQSELKVDPMLHKSYLAQIADGTPIADIEKAYKQLHEGMSKYMDGVKRSQLSSYTEAKKVDSKVPVSTKGTAPKNPVTGKFEKTLEYSKNREEARAQIVQQAVASMRANRNAS